MRKILTLFLLIIVLMQVLGYYFVFRVRQIELKAEIQQYLRSHQDDHRVTQLQFFLHNGQIIDERFNWEDKEEFEFAGNMYDVIESRIENNRMTVYCVRDDKENELLKSFEYLQNHQSRDEKGKAISLFQFFASVYVIPDVTSIPPIGFINLSAHSFYVDLLPIRSEEIITPPPQDC